MGHIHLGCGLVASGCTVEVWNICSLASAGKQVQSQSVYGPALRMMFYLVLRFYCVCHCKFHCSMFFVFLPYNCVQARINFTMQYNTIWLKVRETVSSTCGV